MGYPADLLNRDEEIVVDLRPHWWYIAPSSAVLAVALLLGVVVLANDLWDVLDILIGVAVLVALGWFATRYAQWMTTDFVVTTDRVIYRVGVFAKQGTEIPVEKINAVHFSQRIFERMLGLGTLRIESAAESGASEFEDIRKPSLVQNLIYQQMDLQGDREVQRLAQAAQRGAEEGQQARVDVPEVAPTASIPEQIEKLDELRRRGAITEEEFQAKKAQLLDRM